MLRSTLRHTQKLGKAAVFSKFCNNGAAYAVPAIQNHREYGSGHQENHTNGYYAAAAGAIGLGAGIVLWMNNRKTAYCSDNWTYKKPTKVNVMKKPGESKSELKALDLESKTKEPEQAVQTEANTSPISNSEVTQSQSSEVAESQSSEVKQDLPSHIPFLIIGAGTAAMAAYRAIRTKDPKAKVLLIGEEEHNPYMRPPLSKDFWFTEDRSLIEKYKFSTWSGRPRSIFFESEQYFCKPNELTNEKGGVAVATGRTAVKLNTATRVVTLNDGSEIGYDKCLIATGGTAKSLPSLVEGGSGLACKTTLYRTIEDYKRLDEITNKVKSILVIGGGFLGSELAVALSYKGNKTGLKVTQCFPESGNMARVLPQYLSEWTTKEVKKYDVNVLPNVSVNKATLSPCGDKIVCNLDNGEKIEAEHVVVAVGLEPNTQLAESAGLEVDDKLGGFMVNAELEAASNVWVAGDAACFYDVKLGRRRVEHHDHAVVSGRLAGENMTGASKRFTHQSMFWSDIGPEIGYEAIGLVDSSLHTVAVFAKSSKDDTPQAAEKKTSESLRSETEQNSAASESSAPEGPEYGKGVVFYMKGKKVVGVVCWNVFNKIGIARKIIRDGAEHDDLTEVSKLFELYPNKSTDNTNSS